MMGGLFGGCMMAAQGGDQYAGKTALEVTIPSAGFSFSLYSLTMTSAVEVGWGDGTVQSVSSAQASHTYTQPGTYVITLGDTLTGCGVHAATTATASDTNSSCLTQILAFGPNHAIIPYCAFYRSVNLVNVCECDNPFAWDGRCFSYSSSIGSVPLSMSSITKFDNNAHTMFVFEQCTSLKKISLPYITSWTGQTPSRLTALEEFACPNLASVTTGFLYGDVSLTKAEFGRITTSSLGTSFFYACGQTASRLDITTGNTIDELRNGITTFPFGAGNYAVFHATDGYISYDSGAWTNHYSA